MGVEVGPAGRCGYAATARPMRPRASSSPMTSAALSSGVSVSVGEVHVRGRRSLVGVADAGELLDLAGERLRVEALDVAVGALLHRRVHEDLDERRRTPPPGRARRRPRLDVRGDGRHQGHDAGAGESARHPADAPDVGVAVLLGEAEALREVRPHHVAVEVLDERSAALQLGPHELGDGRLSGAREPGEPQGEAGAIAHSGSVLLRGGAPVVVSAMGRPRPARGCGARTRSSRRPPSVPLASPLRDGSPACSACSRSRGSPDREAGCRARRARRGSP